VVEDEMIIAASIVSILKKLNYVVASSASNYQEAIEMIEREQPELLLLDINLGGRKDGIDVADYVRANHQLPIIFLTANSDTATVQRAKTVKPNAYLLKPFTKDDLYSAIEIAFSNFQGNNDSIVQKESILFKTGYVYINLKFSDIVFIESNDNYVAVHMLSGKPTIIRSTLGDMLHKLPPASFTRISRSVIVNHASIQKIGIDQITVSDKTFAITSKYKQELLDKLG
jgi:DNA-binding LytR/AlgR family response regulator